MSLSAMRGSLKCFDEDCRMGSCVVSLTPELVQALARIAQSKIAVGKENKSPQIFRSSREGSLLLGQALSPPLRLQLQSISPERSLTRLGAQPSLQTYMDALPLIKQQLPSTMLPKRVGFGESWMTNQFFATELIDGNGPFHLHTCQDPVSPHGSALVTHLRDRSTGLVCVRTASDGTRKLHSNCAQHPPRSMWPIVSINLFINANIHQNDDDAIIRVQDQTYQVHDNEMINGKLNDVAASHLDTALAELFYVIQGNRFVRYLLKDDAWATFDKHVWEIGTRGSGIVGAFLKNACVPVIDQAIRTFLTLKNGQLTKEEDRFISKMREAKRHIQGTTGQSMVAQQLQTITSMVAKTHEEFRLKLNANTDLFAFTNGVFDMRHMQFREIVPEDMISRNCGREFVVDRVMNEDARREIRQIVYNIFAQDREVGDFFMLELAGALGGHNLSQTMSCLLGTGANGKSTLYSLIQAAFGSYVKSMYSSWITGPDKDADSNTNQLVYIEHARLVIISVSVLKWPDRFVADPAVQEMNEKERVNKRRLKMLTGGDVIPIRGIREAFRDFRARAKLM